ncbi:unnamed protein product [Sphagnum jensenii]|uniref:Phosphatidic acid phosphatase type 2/haloperoxidase domain-containing protein n=1 Tax=Sphagnum jensenii TaxID=128206 RepID=A0ABP1B6E2_9BRYO
MAQATSNTINWKLEDLLKFYWTDWVFTGVLIALEIFFNWIHPHERYVGEWMFVTGELRYPFKPETVPFIFLPVIALVVPMIFIVSYYIWRQNIQDLHNSTLGLFTAVLLTGVIVDAIKSGVGRPRPHFYAQCFGSTTAIAMYDGTGNVICSGNPASVREAYKSFPSGHTAWIFSGMGYLSLYLAGKLAVINQKYHPWKFLTIFLPLLVATFVGISRINDYHHHWTDVLVGAIMGLGVACFCYRQFFPSLWDENASRPFIDKQSDYSTTSCPLLSADSSNSESHPV